MPIRVECPGCGKGIKAPDNYAGKSAKCPGCGAAIKIPGASPPATESVPVPAPLAPPIPVVHEIEFPSFEPAVRPVARAEVTHTHKARGTFRTGFGLAMGCLVAFATMAIGGCVVVAYMAGQAAEGIHEVVQEVDKSIKKAEAKVIAEKDARAEALRPILTKIDVQNIRIESLEYMSRNVVKAEFSNQSDRAVSSVTVLATYKTPGREMAWAEGELLFRFDGGLEPGETREEIGAEKVLGSSFSNTESRDDARFTFKLIDAEVPSMNVEADSP